MNRRNLKFFVSTKGLALSFGVLAMIAAIIQALFGSNSVVLLGDITKTCIGLLVFRRYSELDICVWIHFFLVVGDTLLDLLVKTLVLQRIESNLNDAKAYHLIELLAIVSISTSLLINRRINVGYPIFKPISDVHALRVLRRGSVVASAIGWHFSGAPSGDTANQIVKVAI